MKKDTFSCWFGSDSRFGLMGSCVWSGAVEQLVGGCNIYCLFIVCSSFFIPWTLQPLCENTAVIIKAKINLISTNIYIHQCTYGSTMMDFV